MSRIIHSKNKIKHYLFRRVIYALRAVNSAHDVDGHMLQELRNEIIRRVFEEGKPIWVPSREGPLKPENPDDYGSGVHTPLLGKLAFLLLKDGSRSPFSPARVEGPHGIQICAISYNLKPSIIPLAAAHGEYLRAWDKAMDFQCNTSAFAMLACHDQRFRQLLWGYPRVRSATMDDLPTWTSFKQEIERL